MALRKPYHFSDNDIPELTTQREKRANEQRKIEREKNIINCAQLINKMIDNGNEPFRLIAEFARIGEIQQTIDVLKNEQSEIIHNL